ncbi:Reverse transcriptase [Phytophthora palmivora]|uniref:Reverse transcriptase n=1 Tax=Phytophthora palmivora TaxID=4796 RepID=A0A2P4XVU1_9STRA|nr:Reverse transcriptase [Phytophthora palmivora]
MRVLAASLVGNPLPEHIKVTVFMDGVKVGPSRTLLFRVHAKTMDEAIQIALQEDYNHRQARTPTSVWQGHNASSGAVQGAPAAGLAPGRYPWNWTVARNGDKYADALHESEGRGQVANFDSTESFLVLDMDKDDLILGMPCLATGHETKAHCQACKIATTASPNAESRRAVWASTAAVPDGTDQADNIETVHEGPLAELKAGELAEVLLKTETSPEDLNSSSVMDEDVLEGFTMQRATRLYSGILKYPGYPVYPLVNEFSNVVSKHQPAQLPPDRRVRHEIDLAPGTKYCVTRQWPLPRKQCEVIDDIFAKNAKSVMTPISRKDELLINMSGCTLYSALDLVDGYYQILMRDSDIPLIAVSTPNGMLWE